MWSDNSAYGQNQDKANEALELTINERIQGVFYSDL